MPELFVWMSIPTFFLFTFLYGYCTGMHDVIPRDPQQRVARYLSAALLALKDELSGAEILGIGPTTIHFRRSDATSAKLQLRGERLCLEAEGETRKYPLGQCPELLCSRDGQHLLIQLVAAENKLHRRSVEIRLPVQFGKSFSNLA